MRASYIYCIYFTIYIFIDTNIFIEYFESRIQFESVRKIFNALEDERHIGFISVGSFYTIAYIVDQGFKRKGLNKSERIDLVRSVLLKVLDLTEVIGANNENLRKGIVDIQFSDLEDSLQYQTALMEGCDIFITLNIKDFKGAEPNLIRVLTPQQFVEEFLEG